MNTDVTTRTVRIALCGNPNSGKSTIFNYLTGLRQKVANYPGVTVAAHTGTFSIPANSDVEYSIIDVPGSYSLSAMSPDEYVAVQTLIGSPDTTSDSPGDSSGSALDLVIVVLDASNLDRGLYLLAQIAEAGIPTIVVLNQIDIAERRNIRVDEKKLASILGLPVLSAVAHKGRGLNRLKELIANHTEIPPAKSLHQFNTEVESFLIEFSASVGISNNGNQAASMSRPELIRALFDRRGPAEGRFLRVNQDNFNKNHASEKLEKLRRRLAEEYRGLPFAEAYPLAKSMAGIAEKVISRTGKKKTSGTARIDSVVLHKYWGPLILLGIMVIVFQSIFTWAEPLMNLIDSGTSAVGALVGSTLPEGAFRSLVVDGVIGGVGSVIVFLPQIIILFFFLGLLEDSGYLPRASFIVDRLFRWCGLSGKSFVPMLSSFACAIPGIMATRVIESRRQRLLTILVAPLMSCSARLPIYTVLISAFIPFQSYYGVFNSQGLTLVGLYALGMVVAIVVSLTLKATALKGESESFVMELPTFKAPTLKGIWIRVSISASAFLKRAGTVIFAVTIVVWALSYYPRSPELQSAYDTKVVQIEQQSAASLTPTHNSDSLIQVLSNQLAGENLRQSFIGRMGRTLEPVFKPLGWDWKITIAALSAFPAREVVIATLGTIYNLGEGQDETSGSLVTKLREATWDDGERAGQPVFNVAVAISIMVFFALCAQCGSTLAVIQRETNSWLWPAFVFTYMTTLAYLASWGAYNLVQALGF
jgi:ferrous iron transport protein B